MTGGFICRCDKCGREERSGPTPLRDGWPKCDNCGLGMTLIESDRFIAEMDEQMGAAFANVGEIVSIFAPGAGP